MSTFKLSDFETGEVIGESVEAAEPQAAPEEAEANEASAEVNDAEAGEDVTAEAEPSEEEPEGEPEKAPRKGKSVQERFDKITAEKHEALGQAEYWRGVAEGRVKPREETPQQQVDQLPERPKPDDYEFGDADPAYMEALADWKAELKVAKLKEELKAERHEEAARAQAQQAAAYFAENLAKAKERIPDIDETMAAAGRNEFPCGKVMSGLIQQSPVGPDVAHYLRNNLEEAIAIDQAPPFMQAAIFGALAAKLSSEGEEKPQAKVTQTPAPPKTLSRGSGGQFETTEREMYRKMLKEFR